MWKIFSLFFLVFAATPSQSVTDRPCGTNLARLWLDIVFVVDNSRNMNMYNVFNSISSLFSPFVQIGTGYDDPRSTRVGFITYNWNATDVADFYKLQSYSDLSSQIQALSTTGLSRVGNSYIDTGLQAAIRMINATGGLRDNYQKVVVLFTSQFDYYNYPENLATYLQSIGVTIVTVNTGGDNTVTQSLKNYIASKGFAFTMADGNTTMELQRALLTVNCFCRPGWMQYHYPLKSTKVYSNYGICVYRPLMAMNRLSAQNYCHGLTANSYLVSELDQQKRAFNWEYLNSKGSDPTHAFYNGLTYYNGTWWWDQPSGMRMWPLDPNSGAAPARAGCVADVKYSDGTISWTPISCTNIFRFLCESSACDTDNYCDL